MRSQTFSSSSIRVLFIQVYHSARSRYNPNEEEDRKSPRHISSRHRDKSKGHSFKNCEEKDSSNNFETMLRKFMNSNRKNRITLLQEQQFMHVNSESMWQQNTAPLLPTALL